MAETKVIMPQMGESIFEGTLTKWLKKPGDKVERDEPLFEISTDKIDSEIPAPAAGTLQKILVQEGQTVEINTVVAIIGDGAACRAAAAAPRRRLRRTAAARQKPTPERPQPSLKLRKQKEDDCRCRRTCVTHRHRWCGVAKEHGIDLAALAGQGTGINGRITKNDILNYIEQEAAPVAPQPGCASRPSHRGHRTRADDGHAQVDRRAHGDQPAHVGPCHDVLRSGLLEHHGGSRKAEGRIRTRRGRS